MSTPPKSENAVARRRALMNWTQGDLAERSGLPRTSVSAIEGGRLTPSVTAALALAQALECSVEELFGTGGPVRAGRSSLEWAWQPAAEPVRYWEAVVGARRLLFPVESLTLNPLPHDGVWTGGAGREVVSDLAEHTLVMASCDPAAGLLASEYARASGFRMIVLNRGGEAALELLKQGLVHVAGLHRSTTQKPARNAESIRARMGGGYRLLRVAEWEEGLVTGLGSSVRSASSLVKSAPRWALREPGSAARECLDEMLASKVADGRVVSGHLAVAEAVRAGWAEAGVCVRLAAEEMGLKFLPVRTESLDLCFAAGQQHDPRLQALVRLLRSRSQRRIISELPGYDARHTGELETI